MTARLWLLTGAGVILVALAIRRWRKAGQVLDAILRDEDPQ